jgi:hypothetical protein
MRLLRILATATGVAALLAQPSAAQGGRQFKDAWFWGAKAGSVVYSSAITNSSAAPLFGGEWLITRTNGGLYVSFDQAYLTTQGGFAGRDLTGQPITQYVDVGNLRRLTAAAMVFPMQRPTIHPYAGLGFAFYQLGHVNLASGNPSPAQADSIQARKTAVAPILIVGTQVRLLPASLFVQGFASPTQKAFFLSNAQESRTLQFGLEFGIRYNVGGAIDRNR